MSYPTPSEEFDGVVIGLRLMVKAVDLIDICSNQPTVRAEYLQEAAKLLKDAWMAVQTAAGRALKESWQQEPPEGPSEPELELFGGEESQ